MAYLLSHTGQPRRITSKIGSLANANYKPGGGNVKKPHLFLILFNLKYAVFAP